MAGVPPGLELTVGDDSGQGLCAHLGPSIAGRLGPARWLPLTDVDGRELVAAGAPDAEDPAALTDVILRASRLVDDLDDVRRVYIPLGGGGPMLRALIWTGPSRGTEDDPSVRRLASQVLPS